MVQYVHNTIHYVSRHFKSYQQEVWHLISYFQDFNIIYVPTMSNAIVDALGNFAARLSPLMDNFSIEIIYRPYVHNNTTNLCIFYDGQ